MRRTTHQHDGEVVVFLIGMQVRRPWHVRTWMQSFLAMPRMLKELSSDRDSGLLGFRLTLEGFGATVIQYWESTEKLYAYANSSDHEHRPAWVDFYRAAKRRPGAVGVWHETYVADRAESVYVEMPTFGLAKATQEIPIGKRLHTAADRLPGRAV